MKTIKSIKTAEGEYQIDYNGLANLPESGATPEGFLPHGTVIKVELDGSGDFTSIEDAISFLVGKWSNGTVSIQLGLGTFEVTKELAISSSSFNFSKLEIKGSDIDGSVVSYVPEAVKTSTAPFYAAYTTTPLTFANFTIRSVRENNSRCIRTYGVEPRVLIRNMKLDTAVTGITASNGSSVSLENVSFYNCNQAIQCSAGAKISTSFESMLVFDNCNTGLSVTYGGIIALYGAKYTKTNVTTLANKTIGSVSTDGWITGNWTQA